MSTPHPREEAGSEPAAKRERREQNDHHPPPAGSSGDPAAKPSLQKLVAAHYDARPNVSIQGRQESVIFHLRNLNNWVKSVLIARVTSAGDYIFDICGGKGGDLKKWQQGRVRHVVLADHAAKSVEEARQRYNQSRANFSAQFIVADCFKTFIPDRLAAGMVFDVVSCQFALHYSFETEARAKRFLENVSARLQPKGAFIATIPDAVRIVNLPSLTTASKRMRELPPGINEFGNSIYTVQFSQGRWTEPPPFGAEYLFTLKDAVDRCPEWLVHLSVLETYELSFAMPLMGSFLPCNRRHCLALAAAVDLELESTWLFDEFFAEFSRRPDNAQLLHRMQALNSQGTISPEEWEAATLYRVVVFRKKATAKPPSTIGERPKPRPESVPSDAVLKLE